MLASCPLFARRTMKELRIVALAMHLTGARGGRGLLRRGRRAERRVSAGGRRRRGAHALCVHAGGRKPSTRRPATSSATTPCSSRRSRRLSRAACGSIARSAQHRLSSPQRDFSIISGVLRISIEMAGFLVLFSVEKAAISIEIRTIADGCVCFSFRLLALMEQAWC